MESVRGSLQLFHTCQGVYVLLIVAAENVMSLWLHAMNTLLMIIMWCK